MGAERSSCVNVKDLAVEPARKGAENLPPILVSFLFERVRFAPVVHTCILDPSNADLGTTVLPTETNRNFNSFNLDLEYTRSKGQFINI